MLTALLLAGCSHSPAVSDSAREPSADESFSIIDAHAHFNRPEKNPNQPAADMMDQFKKAGVVGAVVILHPEEARYTKITRPKGFKMAVCAAVAPGEAFANIEAGLKSGAFECMKIFLGYVPKWAMDPFYHPYYRLAAKYGAPVIFHTGDTYTKDSLVKYAEPLQIDEVAVKYPKVKFVIAHMGNPWIQSAAEVVYKNDNVYTDVSAFLLGDVSKADPDQVEEIVVKSIRWFYHYVDNPKKILFGSDWPLLEVGPYVEAVKRAIPKKHWKAVFHDNAVNVFNLKEEK